MSKVHSSPNRSPSTTCLTSWSGTDVYALSCRFCSRNARAARCRDRTRIEAAAEGHANVLVRAQAIAYGAVVDGKEALDVLSCISKAQLGCVFQSPVLVSVVTTLSKRECVGWRQSVQVQLDGLRTMVRRPGNEPAGQVELIQPARDAQREEGFPRRSKCKATFILIVVQPRVAEVITSRIPASSLWGARQRRTSHPSGVAASSGPTCRTRAGSARHPPAEGPPRREF